MHCTAYFLFLHTVRYGQTLRYFYDDKENAYWQKAQCRVPSCVKKQNSAKIHDNPPILVYTDYMGLVLLFCDTKAGLCPLGRGFSRAGKRCKNRDSADRQPVFSKEKIHQ